MDISTEEHVPSDVEDSPHTSVHGSVATLMEDSHPSGERGVATHMQDSHPSAEEIVATNVEEAHSTVEDLNPSGERGEQNVATDVEDSHLTVERNVTSPVEDLNPTSLEGIVVSDRQDSHPVVERDAEEELQASHPSAEEIVASNVEEAHSTVEENVTSNVQGSNSTSDEEHILDVEDTPQIPEPTPNEGGSELTPDTRAPEDTSSSEAQPQAVLSYWKIIVIGVYAFCGTSFTYAPYAIMDGGWLSLLVLMFVSMVAYFNALLLRRCFNNTSRTLEDVGGDAAHHAYGRILISIHIWILSYATCIGAVLMIKDNLQLLFDGCELPDTVVLLLIVLVTIRWRVRENNPWVPGLGVILMVSVLILMLFSGLTTVGFHGKTVLFNKSNIHMTIGFYVYSFSGHSCMPMFYTLMQEKENYWKVVLIIMGISTFLYGAIASLGYGMFGNDLKSAFTLNLPAKSTLTMCAIVFTIFDHLIRYLLNITTVITYNNTLFDHYLHLPEDWVNQEVIVTSTRFLITFLPILLSFLPAIFIDFFAELNTFCGATVGVMVSLIIPVVCFYRIRWLESTRRERVYASFIFIIGVGGALFTIIRSITRLAQAT